MKAPLVVSDSNERQRLEALLATSRGYTPEWLPVEGAAGQTLLKVLARYLQVLSEGVNRAPERGFMSFLDTLGGNQLPAQAARAPLVFRLLENAPLDVNLPAGARVAAQPQPVLPTTNNGGQQQTGDPLIFATTQAITLTRARLAAVHSLDPNRDAYSDHTSHLESGFTLFDAMEPTGHLLYLGHDRLFNLAGDITVLLYFSLDEGSAYDLHLTWEYLAESGWLPLESDPNEDTTGGLRESGQLALRRECGPNAKSGPYDGRSGKSSFWLRGKVGAPLPPRSIDPQTQLPRVNDIRARLQFSRSGLLPEAAFADSVSLDVSKEFHPFGQQPPLNPAFYLASREAFGRAGARVSLQVALSQAGAPTGGFVLSWQFHDGFAWRDLSVETTPDSSSRNPPYMFSDDGVVAFTCPSDWAESEVNGVTNYWLRVRVVSGNFGMPARLNQGPDLQFKGVPEKDRSIIVVDTNQGLFGGERLSLRLTSATNASAIHLATVKDVQGMNRVVLDTPVPTLPAGDDYVSGTITRQTDFWDSPLLLPSSFRPPVVSKIALGYAYLTDPEALDHCFAYNDFIYTDHSADAIWADRSFTPFQPVDDSEPAVYFAFDLALPTGLISLYLDVPQEAETSDGEGSLFDWEYHSPYGWVQLSVLDETRGFQRSGMLQFIGPPDAVATWGLGNDRVDDRPLYRIRARLKVGARLPDFRSSRVWLNAVWAAQRSEHPGVTVGSSDGGPNQSFGLTHQPVLEDEHIEIQEWRGRGERWRITLQDVPEKDVRREQDPATGEPRAAWVTWHARPHLFASGPQDRHYTIDRSTGIVRFGDGHYGRIPPAGTLIRASFASGGDLAGNVSAGVITELHSAVPYVESAFNPIPAAGGCESEPVADTQMREPQRLRHRGRGVSADDIAWLARQASPEVARARCLPVTGPIGRAQRGWLTVVIVPRSLDPRPQPTPTLLRRVRDFLAAQAPASAARHIRVIGPHYCRVDVQTEIVPSDPADAARVETELRQRLSQFLHPLTGGRDGQGWGFGEPVRLSYIAALIETTQGVDRVRRLRLAGDGNLVGEVLEIEGEALVAPGQHEMKLTLGGV